MPASVQDEQAEDVPSHWKRVNGARAGLCVSLKLDVHAFPVKTQDSKILRAISSDLMS